MSLPAETWLLLGPQRAYLDAVVFDMFQQLNGGNEENKMAHNQA